MRIHVLSDLHLEFAPFAPQPVAADVVVLAGDIANGAAGVEWTRETFDAPVLYLAGNHEYYDHDFDAAQSALRRAACGAVTLLDCSETTIGGVRFIGCTLWTDYTLAPQEARGAVIEAARARNPDYLVIRRGARLFSPEDAIALCAAQRAWLEAKLAEPFAGRTVVVTHFAPHPKSIAPAYAGDPANPGFIVDLEPLMGSATLWIHGHTHTFFDYAVRGTRVVCNPRGYPGEPTEYRPGFVVVL